MAHTLAEAAKLSQDDLQRGVIETFIRVSPILDAPLGVVCRSRMSARRDPPLVTPSA